MNECATVFATHNSLEGTWIVEVKNDNRQVIIFTQRNRGTIHDFKPHVQCPHVAQCFELTGIRIMHGIIVIHTIHFGCFEQDLGIEFDGSQGSSCISREERIAAACREDDYATLFQVAYRAAANKWFGHWRHLDSRLHTSDHTQFFHRILHYQGIHDRGQHADVVGGSAVYARCSSIGPTPHVPATDDHCHLYPQILHALDLFGNTQHQFRVNTVST